MRRNPIPSRRERLLAKNGRMCCVCKASGVGVQFHHIDGDHSNTVDENLAVLCVADHDAHHRPNQYQTRQSGVECGRNSALQAGMGSICSRSAANETAASSNGQRLRNARLYSLCEGNVSVDKFEENVGKAYPSQPALPNNPPPD